MPVITLGNLASSSQRFWVQTELFAVMAWSRLESSTGVTNRSYEEALIAPPTARPSDARRRREFLVAEAGYSVGRAKVGGGPMMVDPATWRPPWPGALVPDAQPRFDRYGGVWALTLAPAFGTLQERLAETVSGILAAGLVLALIRRMDLNHRPLLRGRGGSSISRAINIIEELSLPMRMPKFPRNDPAIRRAWSAHRSAAHLCAAFADLVLEAAARGEDVSPRALFVRIFREQSTFLRLARIYQAFALTFTPTSRRTPLLRRDEAWLIPELPSWPVLLTRPAHLGPSELKAVMMPTKPKRRRQEKRAQRRQGR